MKLSAAQEKMISEYLRTIADELEPLGDDARRSALMRARARIREELRLLGTDTVGDKDILSVLDTCGAPDAYAERLIRSVKGETGAGEAKSNGKKPVAAEPWSLDTDERRFLGVCAGVARELDLAPRAVRGFALLLLITGPFALVLYLAAYGVMYTRTDPAVRMSFDGMRLAKSVAIAFAVAVAIHLAASLGIRGLDWAYAKFASGSLAAIDLRYAWLPGKMGGYLFWALMWSLPLAAFAGLPVSKGWSGTFTKLAHASLAVYAVGLAYGYAALIVGVALAESKNLQGIDPAAILAQYLYS